MGRKRTTVFADEDDLAIIKSAAARRGVHEAEILRDAIHLAAMADRTWDEPFFTHTYAPSAHGGTDQAAEATWAEKADADERTKIPGP